MANQTKNVMVIGRWDQSGDQEKIANALGRMNGQNVSDRSVTVDAPLASSGNHLIHDLRGKIDSSSAVFVPARPSSTRDGSVTRKEIDYAISQGKQVIAVDTGSTASKSTYFADNDIPVVPCRKDSLKNALD